MNDTELAAYMVLTPEEAEIIIPRLTPEKRAVFDRMREVEIEASIWMQGLGPKPTGVLIDTERDVKRRRGWRRSGFQDNGE